MSATDERNERVRKILNKFYDDSLKNNLEIDESSYKNLLEKLFSTSSWGFREILLVVIVGMKLDSSYKASTGLYDCTPRAIYEGPIKEFLIEKGIPHRKSGPLNIAKATVGLDMTWATQRSPKYAAEAVVNLVNYMEKDRSRVDNVGISLMRRFISLSKQIASLAIDIEPTSDPEFLYYLCRELINEVPDGGNTPQKIAAFLLKHFHYSLYTGVTVTGEEDRASVTSTTSKKPGDINEENPEGVIRKVYEVTVKHFDIARIRDSYDCICIYNNNHKTNIHEVIVICRKEDCPSEMISSGLHEYLGSYVYQDIIYYYWDIYEWIADTLQRMTAEGRKLFYLKLNSYINDINTSEDVKIFWKKLHTNKK